MPVRDMSAELLILCPVFVEPAIDQLVGHGFEFLIHEDRIDEAGPTVFMRVFASSELDDFAFFNWVHALVERFTGDVQEVGVADEDEKAAWREAQAIARRRQFKMVKG
jgi:hypothetical protein